MSENQKYTIAAVQQDKLLSYGLDIKDAFILSYLKDINSARRIVRRKFSGKIFMWINYSKLMEYLPVLKIKTVDALYRRFKKYEDLGIVSKEIKRNDKVGFMAERLGEPEVRRLRNEILRENGFECSAIDDQLGNILCRKFNNFIDEGGIFVR